MPTSICTDTLSHPHYPSPCTMSLPPLSKGGGLTARHKLLLCCVLLAICPPFLCYKLFCRQDGGIVTPSPLPKPHYPSPRTKLVSLVKGEVLSPEKIRATTGGIVTPPTLPKTALSPSLFVMLTSVCTNMFSHPHYPTKTANTLASPRKRGGGTADTNFSLAVQYSDSPAFTILKLFRAVTVGIVSP